MEAKWKDHKVSSCSDPSSKTRATTSNFDLVEHGPDDAHLSRKAPFLSGSGDVCEGIWTSGRHKTEGDVCLIHTTTATFIDIRELCW